MIQFLEALCVEWLHVVFPVEIIGANNVSLSNVWLPELPLRGP